MDYSAASVGDEEKAGENPANGLFPEPGSGVTESLLARGKEQGYLTYGELISALPPGSTSSAQIQDTMTALSELGISVVENEESEDAAADTDQVEARGNLNDDNVIRTDDPVRMYLREMSSVSLLSREGEIAIAKRIEAGREMMISGICESPLTVRAIIGWRNALDDGKMLLRDIIDLEATYRGGGFDQIGVPAEAAIAPTVLPVDHGSGTDAADDVAMTVEVESGRGDEESEDKTFDLARGDGNASAAERDRDLRGYRRSGQSSARSPGPTNCRLAQRRGVGAGDRAAPSPAQIGGYRTR